MRDLLRYQQEYFKQPYEPYQVHYRKRNLLELMKKYGHRRILEVGCGSNPLFEEIHDFQRMVVLEPGPMFYRAAVKLLKKRSSIGEVVIYNKLLEDCLGPLKNEAFDFIVVSSLLHEVEKPEYFLRMVRSISNPNSVVHVNVPNAQSFHRLLALEMGLIANVFEKSKSQDRFQQHSVFTLETLSALAAKCGFKIFESGSYAIKPFTHRQMQAMLDKKVLTRAMIEGLYRMIKYIPDLGSEIFINIKITKS